MHKKPHANTNEYGSKFDVPFEYRASQLRVLKLV